MPELINSISLKDLVDAVGVAGFVLSLVLAVTGALANRLSVSANPVVLIDDNSNAPESVFLLVTLSNQTRVPFSLTSLYLLDRTSGAEISFEKTIRTYTQPASDNRLAAKPVVLSQAFPARFEPYDSKVFLLGLSRPNIDMKLLRQGGPAHNPEGRGLPPRSHGKPCTHRLPLRLVLNTSRGRRAIPM